MIHPLEEILDLIWTGVKDWDVIQRGAAINGTRTLLLDGTGTRS